MRCFQFWFWLIFLHSDIVLAQWPDPGRFSNWKDAGLFQPVPVAWQDFDFVQAGGVPDGVTPNATILKTMLAGLPHDSCRIIFPTGVYYFRNPVNLNRRVVLKGVSPDSTTLLFRLGTLNDLIFSRGSRALPDTGLVRGIDRGSSWILSGSAAGFSAGDDVEIRDNDSLLVVSEWALGKTGQLNRIRRISGDTLFLLFPMRRAYDLVHRPRVCRLMMRQGIGLEGFRLVRLDSTAGQSSNIEFNLARDCWVRCVESVSCNFAHVALNSCRNVEVSGSWFRDGFGYGEGGRAYGIVLQAGTGQCLVRDNLLRHLRHSILVQSGANGNVIAYNHSWDPYWDQPGFPSDFTGDIVFHGNYPYGNLVEGNIVQNLVFDASHGRNGPDNFLFRNRTERYGILMSSQPPTSDGQVLVANEIANDSTNMGNFLMAGSGHFLYGNNRLGQILPPGTDTLSRASLFLATPPPFYAGSLTAWPPIGIPNGLQTGTNEARWRRTQGRFTPCSGSSPTEVSEAETSLPDVLLFPNPTEGTVWISGLPRESGEVQLEVLSPDGRKTAKAFVEVTGPGVPIRYEPGKLSPGLYLLRVGSGDRRVTLKFGVVKMY